jgi:hypothetical protein
MAYKLSNVKGINPIGPSCRKKTYYSLEEAMEMIRYIRENRRVREISTYQCSLCGFWHLTSKSK